MPETRRSAWSAAILAVAIAALAANCFLTSPQRFDDRPWPPNSLLRPVVETLGLHLAAPTLRGVEIRNLAFYVGAATLALVAGIYLLKSRRDDNVIPDELDLDAVARSPLAWWVFLLIVSALSSFFSHAPRIAAGGTLVRALWLVWWWPLAAVLVPRDAARLAKAATALLALLAALGLWYQFERAADPARRLSYPIGNEGWMAACLLPAVVIAAVHVIAGNPGVRCLAARALWLAAALLIGYALLLTRARSAAVGAAAAICVTWFLVAGRAGRAALALVLLASAAGGAWWLNRVRAEGTTALRAESVRSRLEHEWPIAVRLFLQKPMMGHGEGGYAMLAGQYAREQQFSEPAITAFDRRVWPSHVHNEYLELLTDLGLAGMLAFLAAIATTLWRAACYVAALRQAPPGSRADATTVVALSAALAAMTAETAFGVALRNPGFPPVFLTVWAALWAIVRPRGPDVETVLAGETRPARARWLPNTAGLVVLLMAVGLGWKGVLDWRAARNIHDAELALARRQPDGAVPLADLAADDLLEPFRQLIAYHTAARARSERFIAWLRDDASPPGRETLQAGEEALAMIDRIRRAAPRFLWLSTLEREVSYGMVRAYERLRRPNELRSYRQRWRAALEAENRDEPFDIDVVRLLWEAAPDASAFDRLRWLRGVMRRGDVDEVWHALFRDLVGRRDFVPTLDDLRKVAQQDRQRTPADWSDVLSPETWRVSARAWYVVGEPQRAIADAEAAEAMYAAAGPRLIGGRGAALIEIARYRFYANPFDTEAILASLDAAASLKGQPTERFAADDVATFMRAAALVAAGRERELRQRAGELVGWSVEPGRTEESTINDWIGGVYLHISKEFMERSGRIDPHRVIDWAARAWELRPEDPEPCLTLAEAYLAAGIRDKAEETIERARNTVVPGKGDALDRAYQLLLDRYQSRPPETKPSSPTNPEPNAAPTVK